jgi:hypothetical protein
MQEELLAHNPFLAQLMFNAEYIRGSLKVCLRGWEAIG